MQENLFNLLHPPWNRWPVPDIYAGLIIPASIFHPLIFQQGWIWPEGDVFNFFHFYAVQWPGWVIQRNRVYL